MPRRTKADDLIAADRAQVRHPDVRCWTCNRGAVLSVRTLDAWGRRLPASARVQQWSCVHCDNRAELRARHVGVA